MQKRPETGEYPEEDLEGDYKIDEKGKRISFTQDGIINIEKTLQKHGIIKDSLYDGDNFEYIHYMTQALRRTGFFTVMLIMSCRTALSRLSMNLPAVYFQEEGTPRAAPGNRGQGKDQGCAEKQDTCNNNVPEFFQDVLKDFGMTGTADTEAKEFARIYNLDVVVIPTNRPVMRDDEDDEVYLNESFKLQAISDEIEMAHKKGQPVLVGTVRLKSRSSFQRF